MRRYDLDGIRFELSPKACAAVLLYWPTVARGFKSTHNDMLGDELRGGAEAATNWRFCLNVDYPDDRLEVAALRDAIVLLLNAQNGDPRPSFLPSTVRLLRELRERLDTALCESVVDRLGKLA